MFLFFERVFIIFGDFFPPQNLVEFTGKPSGPAVFFVETFLKQLY